MTVCCGLVPHLELALHPERSGEPVVIGSGGRVLTASAAARTAGVTAGLTLTQAEALCPQAAVLPAQPAAAARLAERLAAALYDCAPAVEVHLDGRAWLDLEGLPQTARTISEVRRRLRQASGGEPRLGLAPGPFAAALAAARAGSGRLVRVADAVSFLAPLPVSVLEHLGSEQRERLDLLGLRTLGQVAAVGPRQLESQLGPAGRQAVLLARGLEPDRVRRWKPPALTAARRRFEPPVEDREALLFTARALAGDLAAELGLRGAGARRLGVRLEVEGQPQPERRESVVRHPLSSAGELFGLAAAWLREWRPAGPVAELAIELPELEAAGRRQLRLWVGGDGSAEAVEAALERLQERWGEAAALRPRPAPTHSPLFGHRYRLEPL